MDLPLFLLLTLLKYKFSIKYLSEVENKQLRQISLVRKPGVTSGPGKYQRPSEDTQECQEYSDNSMISRLSVLSPIISSALKVDLSSMTSLCTKRLWRDPETTQSKALNKLRYRLFKLGALGTNLPSRFYPAHKVLCTICTLAEMRRYQPH